MSYFEDSDGPVYADYAADREREQDLERWQARRAAMQRGPVVTRLCPANETIVFIGDEDYIHVAKAIGDRANALRNRGIRFDRRMSGRETPGCMSCRLPDGAQVACHYGGETGRILNEALEEIVGIAETVLEEAS